MTTNGLVVPVLRDVDKKGVLQLARETAELAAVARDGKLKLTDIQGGCFTVSSLGGIGGTAFTPIINAPEVAILGVSRLTQKPVYRDFQNADPALDAAALALLRSPRDRRRDGCALHHPSCDRAERSAPIAAVTFPGAGRLPLTQLSATVRLVPLKTLKWAFAAADHLAAKRTATLL